MEENTIDPQLSEVKTEIPEIEDKGTGFDQESFGNDIIAKIEAKFPELVDQVSQKTRDEIVKKIVGEEHKEPEKYVPESYEELMERTVSKAVEAFERKQTEAQARSEAAKKDEEAKSQQVIEANNQYWDKQLGDLEKSELIATLPDAIAKKLADGKELSETDKQHPAVKARIELYSKSRELKDQGDSDWWNLKYVAYRYGIGKGERAAYAPVEGRGSYSENEDRGGYTYEDIHNMSFQELAKNGS